ncbi:hypothetical protein HDU93_006361, partial [Gonapodya sp. JEL0774]
PFTFTGLPAEILLHIANRLESRLGLPTGALNRRLTNIFRTPSSIAVRALAHYQHPPKTLVWECWRSGAEQHLVIKAILERVERCDEFKIDNTAVGPHGVDVTPLVAAAWAGNTTTVKILLNVGASFHLSWVEFIAWACAGHGHLEVVKLLMENGADTQVWLDEFLHEGSSNGHTGVVRFLLNQGAEVNPGHRCYLYGPLQAAALGGHVEVVSILLDHGADIHFSGNEALWFAVREGKAAVVRLLLERGADAIGESEQAKGAMAKAKDKGFTEILDLLRLHSTRE